MEGEEAVVVDLLAALRALVVPFRGALEATEEAAAADGDARLAMGQVTKDDTALAAIADVRAAGAIATVAVAAAHALWAEAHLSAVALVVGSPVVVPPATTVIVAVVAGASRRGAALYHAVGRLAAVVVDPARRADVVARTRVIHGAVALSAEDGLRQKVAVEARVLVGASAARRALRSGARVGIDCIYRRILTCLALPRPILF